MTTEPVILRTLCGCERLLTVAVGRTEVVLPLPYDGDVSGFFGTPSVPHRAFRRTGSYLLGAALFLEVGA